MERTEHLGGGIIVHVNDLHHFSTDSLLLASFAAAAKGDIACDLGTGCGIIPLKWCAEKMPKEIVAVDISENACGLVRRSVEDNMLSGHMTVLNEDLRGLTYRHGEYCARFSLVTMNPPYKTSGDGIKCDDEEKRRARHEVDCTIFDAAECASKLLKFGGRFCVCNRPDRLVDVLESMRKSRIEPKKLRIVCQRVGSAPMLILCEGKMGAKPGLVMPAPLYIEAPDGGYSDEMLAIYGEFKSRCSGGSEVYDER